jgi:hypothetical protein
MAFMVSPVNPSVALVVVLPLPEADPPVVDVGAFAMVGFWYLVFDVFLSSPDGF